MPSENIIQHLCHKLFIGTQDGKKLLELMKEWHLNTPTFPCDPEKMKRHGGAKGWATFRSGQLDMLLRIEQIAVQYEQQLEAEQKRKLKE